ncbi:sortase [Rubrobacter radiotolerans]|uniref:Sortase n=1 Tax=Rubrobacter radiotolerans TaxID=42256 RepID=A0A023X3I1_RUBRA|nr:class E sortase [Rubrobacter radiotolerans]AHY46913.1 sortase [Rubrobacter radiotolerans]MDX5894318.1 class E sortase [Rubrobacter radiotolerans]SMC05724.1 sortase A [Rubrobacter radiotolerans DSM 5868]
MPWTTETEINTTVKVAEPPRARSSKSSGSYANQATRRRGEVRHRTRYGTRGRALRENPRRRRLRVSREPVYQRRRRAALLAALAGLALVLMLLAVGLPGTGGGSGAAPVSKVEPPLLSTAPVVPGGEQVSIEPPEDKTLYLTVPKLGLYGHTVRNDGSAEALDAGAIKIPETGFPWQQNANTYISGHRVGYAGTESYYQFLDLPKLKNGDEVILEDAAGNRYTYRVFKVFAVEPTDVWVTEPLAGRDVVTLQTCTETVNDWETIGPELLESSPDTGRLIVRAERV